MNSFNKNYKEIRNFIFGSNIDEENNELKEIKEIISKKNNFLLFNNLKYKILNWMLMAVSSKEALPIAANKYSI